MSEFLEKTATAAQPKDTQFKLSMDMIADLLDQCDALRAERDAVTAERDAHLLQVARLEMELQAKQDALELVIRENTANVAALARYKAALERISDGAVQPYARIATRALHPEPAND